MNIIHTHLIHLSMGLVKGAQEAPHSGSWLVRCYLIAPHSSSIIYLVMALENDTQYWERLLSVSGGFLELTKCFYYILAWSFTPTGNPILYTPQKIAALSKSIQLQEFGKLTHTTIASKHANEPHKTLGVWKAMTGNDVANTPAIRTRSNNIAFIVGTIGMYPHQ